MANPSFNGATAGTGFGGKLRVEGIQSVVPTKPTDPRQFTRIIVSQNLSSAAVLQRRFHVLLCYNKASDDDSGWLVAGRIRESLGRVMQEHPLLAGRLRRCQESDGGDDHLQIVSNDPGARLVETAAVETDLAGFVQLKERREKAEAEGELVFWEDVHHHNPQFSPLFYVQVTNFTCGGYSIGISCSLFLADPFALADIIKKWANIHSKLVSTSELPKIPTFYLPNHGKPPSSPSLLFGSNTTKDAAESVIFKISAKIPNLDNNIMYKNLAALCVEEAERDTGLKVASNLSLLVKEPSEDHKVEVCSREGLIECSKPDINGMSRERTWDELELGSVCFSEGNKPIYTSCWINSVVDEGFVMIVPSTGLGFNVVVTFT